MDFLTEIRHPTKWYMSLVAAVLALIVFVVLAAGGVSAIMVKRMTSPPSSRAAELNLADFPGHPEKLNFTAPGGAPRDGWFFPGLKNAPAIVLCPGYESSRGELITLASALQEQQYNVFVFDFSGHGSSGGRSTLGLQEVGELKAAMDAVGKRGDVDANRFGLWGMNLGGYVALAEATNDRRVRAIAVESVYNHPRDMVAVQINRGGLGSTPFVTGFAQRIFGWSNSEYKGVQPISSRITNLTGVPQLYLKAPEDPKLAASTAEMFRISPIPHELVELQHGNYPGMLDEDKRSYENRIASFFLLNMPLSGGH